jgi:hypothetical protein
MTRAWADTTLPDELGVADADEDERLRVAHHRTSSTEGSAWREAEKEPSRS